MPSSGDDESDAAGLLATLLGAPAEMLDVTLDQLRTLAVVHVTGTAQRAARALGREQSSVQKQLDNLNKIAARLLGEMLVAKQGRGGLHHLGSPVLRASTARRRLRAGARSTVRSSKAD